MQSTYLTSNSVSRKISFVESGAGPAIVLLPPGASSASAWRQATAELNSQFTTIAINPSGYADTDPFVGERPMSLDDEADAVMAVVSGRNPPISLVGHSYGGAIALRLILRWPSAFDSVTLIEPASYPFLRCAGLNSLATEIEEVNFSFIEHVRKGNCHAAFRAYYEYYNGKQGSWAQLEESIRTKLVALSGTVATALVAVHADPTELSECANVSIPTMVVRGSATDRVHACLSEIVARETPSAKFETVQGAGHMLSLSHPIILTSLIAKHICNSRGPILG